MRKQQVSCCRRSLQLVAIIWLGGSLLLSSGCVSATYSAANLPSEYLAHPLASARHVDLSSLSHHDRPAELLQAGDQVKLTMATGIEEAQPPTWTLRIRDDGMLDIPLVGPVPVVGVAATDAESRIRDESIRRGVYVSPKVTLAVEERRTYRITVAGAVEQPGTYDIPVSDCDVLAAITHAKGLAEDASTTVEIRHPLGAGEFRTANAGGVSPVNGQGVSTSEAFELDISDARNVDRERLRLRDGSVVNVTRQPKRVVNVLGLVRLPAQIPIPPGEELMLLDAIAQAGGTTISFADKVQVVRRVTGEEKPVVIGASLRRARNGGPDNLRLAPGDLVSVEETPTTLVIDSIRTFFRVGFSAALPGM